ncbi:MAG TPA: CBS domain-containing protein [Planctomycetota bacterium]|nr:CBS domain-containing protein [Planctomycetota bacterium]
MTVGRICQREVDLAQATEPVRAAARRMESRNVGSLVVIDEAERPMGILTDRDLALRIVAGGLDADATVVVQVMTPQPRTVSEDTPIEDALGLMRSASVRRLPVVDRKGRLVGVLSLDDILSLLAEEFEEVGKLLERTSPRALADI